MAEFVPFFRVTHTGVYADGRSNTASVLLTDIDYTGQAQQNRKAALYVPAGGFVDIPYSTDSAFSFNQGDIRKFADTGVVTAAFLGVVPPVGTNQYFYQDDPGTDGVGTYAQSYTILIPADTEGVLRELTVRQDSPAAVGETASIRLFRFRKTAPFGSFFLDQITDTYVLDSTDPWSWTIDISSNIRPGFLLDPETDSIAVSNVYTNTGVSTMRALRVDFRVEVVDATTFVAAAATPLAGPVVWPV